MELHVLLAAVLVLLTTLLLLRPRKPAARKGPVALQGPTTKVQLRLARREELSHDTRRFTFSLPSPEHVLGLPVGQHVMISYYDAAGEEVCRPYTPTSSDNDLGVVELVVKVYFKGVNDKFPAGGLMSQHMEALRVGDTMAFQGPKGRFTYKGRGVFAERMPPSKGGGEALRKCTHVGMIAGGTGITPMLQVITAVLRDAGDKTQLSLIFANQTEDDILCKSDLDALATKHANFKVFYTVDRASATWTQGVGFIDAAMIEAHLPPASKSTQVLVCGPPPMVKFACRPALEKLGFTDESLMIW